MSTWRVYRTKNGEAAPKVDFRTLISVLRGEDPAAYLPDDRLVDAVNVAILLGQPLVLTGEPGTGKTQLAHSIAHQLFRGRPIVFNTKTTATARDLFYQYDALRHFRDAGIRQNAVELDSENYITYEALGLAILRAMPKDQLPKQLADRYAPGEPTRSVVLIDEVDKAPRDLPNDVLNEIEGMSFEVKETGKLYSAPIEYRPIVILTSNSEKLLPDAFLRRCVYYHLVFPTHDQLSRIVTARLGKAEWMDRAIARFEEIRGKPLKKPPATAELLGWLRLLQRLSEENQGKDPLTLPGYASSLPVLAKNKEDLTFLVDMSRSVGG